MKDAPLMAALHFTLHNSGVKMFAYVLGGGELTISFPVKAFLNLEVQRT